MKYAVLSVLVLNLVQLIVHVFHAQGALQLREGHRAAPLEGLELSDEQAILFVVVAEPPRLVAELLEVGLVNCEDGGRLGDPRAVVVGLPTSAGVVGEAGPAARGAPGFGIPVKIVRVLRRVIFLPTQGAAVLLIRLPVEFHLTAFEQLKLLQALPRGDHGVLVL